MIQRHPYIFLITALVVLFATSLCVGPVSIPLDAVVGILTDSSAQVKDSWRFIILDNRLPQAVTAVLAGGSLAVSGLLLQTAFRNPLAGPSIFGISSGASLGVALVMLILGGTVSSSLFSLTGFTAIMAAAFTGSMVVTITILAFSKIVRNHVMLLIIGIMIGYLSSSAVTLLSFFATEEGVKGYTLWGMGDFGNVSSSLLPLFVIVSIVSLASTLLFVKPLNALLLGDQYAENLGINTQHVRHWLLLITGLLTAVTTAFCGPIAFIGLAVPHIARLILRTDNHRQLLPTTILTGSVIALLCNVVCTLPSFGTIPINAVTPIIGAPVIIYVILKRY